MIHQEISDGIRFRQGGHASHLLGIRQVTDKNITDEVVAFEADEAVVVIVEADEAVVVIVEVNEAISAFKDELTIVIDDHGEAVTIEVVVFEANKARN